MTFEMYLVAEEERPEKADRDLFEEWCGVEGELSELVERWGKEQILSAVQALNPNEINHSQPDAWEPF
ncbi:MAG: hypothetical protein AAGG02_11470 [Cyanobacteria bacterium P01_H01_bin.15]